MTQYCGLIPCPRARFPINLGKHLQDERVATVDSHNRPKTSRGSSEDRIYPHPIAIGNYRVSAPNLQGRHIIRLT